VNSAFLKERRKKQNIVVGGSMNKEDEQGIRNNGISYTEA
jgi:hypothetical protein